MKILSVLLIWACVAVAPLEAATRWVNTTGGGACGTAVGDADPGVYMTPAAMDSANCPSAGDTIMFKNGTYTTAVNWSTLLPNGTSSSARTKVLCESNQGCILRSQPLTNTTWGVVTFSGTSQHIQFGGIGQGFDIDGISCSASQCKGVLVLNVGTADLDDVQIIGNRVHNQHSDGIVFSQQCSGCTAGAYTNMYIGYNTVEQTATPAYFTQGPPHGIYTHTKGGIIEHNDSTAPGTDNGASGNPQNTYGIQCYNPCRNVTVRYNLVRVPDISRGITMTAGSGGSAGLVYGNVIKHTTGVQSVFCMSAGSGQNTTKFFNNLCAGNFLRYYQNSSNVGAGNELRNTICVADGSCQLQDTRGDLATSGNATAVATNNFKDPTNFDYSLVSGSGQIDAGVAIAGFNFSGTAPDRGAYETFTPTAAVINANTIDITLNPINAPPVPTSATGWTVGCTGTGCGTPVVSNVSLLSGSSTVLRLTITGITGNACAVGQTWTWSFNSTTGSVVDSIKIGGTRNQPMFTYSTQAVTNTCTGAPPDPPSNVEIYYLLDDGTSGTTPTTATDSAGSAENGTLTGGATWTTGKYGSAVQLTADSGQYIAVPYGNGVNPSTQDITVSFGVFVTPGQEGLNKGYFGSSLGTNQRTYISTRAGSWCIGIQTSSDSNCDTALSVVPGWNRVFITFNSTTDTATLCRNGVTATGPHGTKAYTSYTLASNFELGRIGGLATGGGGVFDEFRLWTSVVSCADDYLAWEPPPPAPTGTYAQIGHQWAKIRTAVGGGVDTYLSANATAKAVQSGAIAVTNTVQCTLADCTAIGVRVWYTVNGGVAQSLPDIPTSDGVSFYGATTDPDVIPGSTTSTAVVYDIGQNQTFTHTSIIQFSSTASGTYCFLEYDQTGNPLNGGYTPAAGACVDVGPTKLQRGF